MDAFSGIGPTVTDALVTALTKPYYSGAKVEDLLYQSIRNTRVTRIPAITVAVGNIDVFAYNLNQEAFIT